VKHELEEPSTTHMSQLSVLDSPSPLSLHCQVSSHRYQLRKRSPWRGEVNPGAVPGLLSPSLSSLHALLKNGHCRLLVRRGLSPTPLFGHQQQAC
jgi:hypothetical protein